MLNAAFDADLLSRIEDAGINASAPPQQRWLDGWLLRLSPGKAKRARCIQAVAAGRLPVTAKLALSEPVYRDAGLPMFIRITPFSLPSGLDETLARLGMRRVDDTRVMVNAAIGGIDVLSAPAASGDVAIREGYAIERVGHAGFAQTVGMLRESPLAQRLAHADRLENAPVSFEGYVVKNARGQAVACGQFAREAELAGLYDVYTAESERGRGLATALCVHLVRRARGQGSRVAYLQVEADNLPARRIYQRLGFVDAYAYHYRAAASPPDD